MKRPDSLPSPLSPAPIPSSSKSSAHLSPVRPAATTTNAATSIDFAEAARMLSDQARAMGLLVPAFRSPPRIVGLTRTMRRRSDGSVSLAIAFKNRPWCAVLSDMIEGVVAANQLAGPVAARARDDLWDVVEVPVAAAA